MLNDVDQDLFGNHVHETPPVFGTTLWPFFTSEPIHQLRHSTSVQAFGIPPTNHTWTYGRMSTRTQVLEDLTHPPHPVSDVGRQERTCHLSPQMSGWLLLHTPQELNYSDKIRIRQQPQTAQGSCDICPNFTKVNLLQNTLGVSLSIHRYRFESSKSQVIGKHPRTVCTWTPKTHHGCGPTPSVASGFAQPAMPTCNCKSKE